MANDRGIPSPEHIKDEYTRRVVKAIMEALDIIRGQHPNRVLDQAMTRQDMLDFGLLSRDTTGNFYTTLLPEPPAVALPVQADYRIILDNSDNNVYDNADEQVYAV